MTYLEGKPLPVPEAVTEPPGPGDEEAATVSPDFETGELFLRRRTADRHHAGPLYRLAWLEGDEREDRRRALPPGEYELVGYRLFQRDEDERPWHVSATGRILRGLELEAGSDHPIEIDPTIHVRQRFTGGRLTAAVQGQRHAGLSIYADGARIPLGYSVLDDAGRVRARGSLEYG